MRPTLPVGCSLLHSSGYVCLVVGRTGFRGPTGELLRVLALASYPSGAQAGTVELASEGWLRGSEFKEIGS